MTSDEEKKKVTKFKYAELLKITILTDRQLCILCGSTGVEQGVRGVLVQGAEWNFEWKHHYVLVT